MLKRSLVLFFVILLALTACHSVVYNQTEGNVADVKLRAAAARMKSDHDARTPPPLVVNKGLYVDTTPISLACDPMWLRNRIVIRGDSLPFSYYSRTIATGAGGNILTKYQVGLDPSVAVSMNYTGPVKGALDLLAAKTGFVYSIRRNAIYWQALVTRTFDIAFMPGGTDYLLGKASGSSAGTVQTSGGGGSAGGAGNVALNYVSSDYSDSEYSNLKGTLSIWRDLDTTIKQMLSPQGTVVVSESSTSVTVRDHPSNVELIGQYIANLNHKLAKQVLVKVQVLEIDLRNEWEFGIDWQIIARAFNKSPFVINASFGTPISLTQVAPFTPQRTLPTGGTTLLPTSGVQVQPNTPNPIPSYTILLNALSQQGKTTIVSEPRVVCLNNQVSVVRIVTSEGYLASVQNTALASTSSGSATVGVGTVTSQLTPGTVITGLTLYILPKILGEKIFLQVNADLSTAAPFRTVSSGPEATASRIELPNITEKHFNQRSVIKSGDTLILAGFRQTRNTANAQQFYYSQALGGKGAQQRNLETVVLITPIVLPGSI